MNSEKVWEETETVSNSLKMKNNYDETSSVLPELNYFLTDVF